MKKILLSSSLALSAAAMAFSPNDMMNSYANDFEMFMPEHNNPNPRRGRPDRARPERPDRRHPQRPVNRKKECARNAWRQTRPSQAQNEAAKQILTTAMDQVKAGMPAVRAAFGEVHKALAKHPISKTELHTAVDGVKKVGDPLRSLVQDAHVDVVNLLNSNQRNVFNQVLHRCMKAPRQP
jgi:hypothetical protein